MESYSNTRATGARRIVLFTSEFPPGPGGIGTHALELANNLAMSGYTINVLCEQHYADSEQIKDFNSKISFPIVSLTFSRRNPIIKLSRRVHKLIELVRSCKADVVIASGSTSLWSTTLASFFLNFKMVAIAHGGELTFTSLLSRVLTRFSFKSARVVICVSQFTRSHLPHSIPQKKINVINNGANHNLFRQLENKNDLKRKYGFEDKLVLLTVGSVTERKGQDTVIKALAKCKIEFPNMIYVMAGRSDHFEAFKELASQSGVSDAVFFRGSVTNTEIVELYNLADVYILNSRHSSHGDFEGFGISVIEAALCGLPSIVSKNSGLEEAIEEGITGLGVMPNNSEETAKAIGSLFRNEQLRTSLAEKAKQRAMTQFTWEKVTRQYIEVLDRL